MWSEDLGIGNDYQAIYAFDEKSKLGLMVKHLFQNISLDRKKGQKINFYEMLWHMILFASWWFQLELIVSSSNSESHVDTAQDVVRVGLAVKESLAFIVTLKIDKFWKVIEKIQL